MTLYAEISCEHCHEVPIRNRKNFLYNRFYGLDDDQAPFVYLVNQAVYTCDCGDAPEIRAISELHRTIASVLIYSDDKLIKVIRKTIGRTPGDFASMLGLPRLSWPSDLIGAENIYLSEDDGAWNVLA